MLYFKHEVKTSLFTIYVHYLFNADDMYNKPEDGIQVLGGIVEITTCRSSV